MEKFFKDSRLSFAECRYSRSSVRVFKPHMHRTFSIGAVDRGRVRYRVGPEETVLAVGSLAVINPETVHSCNCLDKEGRSYYMLYLDVDWCRRVQESFWLVDSFVNAENIRIDDVPLYDRYCDTMQLVMNTQTHLLEKEQMLVDLALDVFRHVCVFPHNQEENNNDVDLLREMLGSDLRKDLSLESLAGILGFNPYTMLRKFKAVTGLTPHAYRMNCRIEKAKQYLRRGDDIGETALNCGFFDQSHLHRYFKAMTTVTPKEYRVNFIQ